MRKDTHTRGDCKKKYTTDAGQMRFPEHIKRQALQVCVEGASIVDAIVTLVIGWVKE